MSLMNKTGLCTTQEDKSEQFSQPEDVPIQPLFTKELFLQYPPPADFGLDDEDFAEVQASLCGRPMPSGRPTQEQLKVWGLECYEQLVIYNAYEMW